MKPASKINWFSLVLIGLAVSARLAAGEVAGKPMTTGEEPRVDNWVDVWLLAHGGPAGKAVEGHFAERHDLLDTTDAKQGLFSVRFTVGKNTHDSAFGFSAGPYLKRWELAGDFKLHIWVKAAAAAEPERWCLALYDAAGHKAETNLAGMAADGKWREYFWPLASLQSQAGFDAGAIRSVQVEASLPPEASLWLDDVFFQRGKEVLGVSDKTITQFMAEAAATRPQRVVEALANAGGPGEIPSLSPLYTGVGLEEVNRKIIEWTEKANDVLNGTWGLFENVFVNEAYFGFSSKGKIKPGRLTPECERKLLDYYWKHCEVKNDIATARQSCWWVTGSENHDINFKMANLLSSQIFMHEPDYASRIYPDLGRMQGYYYGDGPVFRAGKTTPVTKLGSGNYKDGKPYNAADHYQAWVDFWKGYLAERTRHGFFIENNAATYSSHTGNFLHDIYAWCEDEELRREARMFLDVVWAQWAQDQAIGFTGGSVTRGSPGWTRLGRMAEFLMGGPGASFYATSDYQWPRQVWEMLLARPAMGEYAYISRKTNEDEDLWPRPAGTEGSMLINRLSRMQRYSWVTPAYVMGSRMDHPNALYTQLFNSREGIIFPTKADAAIYWQVPQALTVQDKGVLLTTGKATYTQRTPPWIGEVGKMTGRIAVSFGQSLDQLVEKDGWIFAQEGNAFAACRIVIPEQQDEAVSEDQDDAASQPPAEPVSKGKKKKKAPKVEMAKAFAFDENGLALLHPNPKGWKWAEAGDVHWKQEHPGKAIIASADIAAVVVEASDRSHHASLEAFMKEVLGNRLVVKPGNNSFIVEYTGCGKDASKLTLTCGSLDIPTVNGKYVNYECPTFQSQWLQGATGSGVVTLTGPLSGSKLVLDFNKIERRKKP